VTVHVASTWPVFHGARTFAEAQNLRAVLTALPQLSIPDSVWPALGQNLAVLRAAGLPMPFQDVLLASVAMHYDIELWSNDGHFKVIQIYIPSLKLFSPP
jgi:predicted nucleic acid-binding protein